MRKLIILALVSMFIQGCATVNSHKFTDKKYPPKPPNTEIQIFTKDIDKPYIEIAAIIAFNEWGWRANSLMQYLKNEARKLGADAIIKLQCSSYNSSTGQYVPIAGTTGVGYLSSYACPKCEGIAVIFNNKEQK